MTALSRLDQTFAVVRRRWQLRDGLLAVSRSLLVLLGTCLLLGWLDYLIGFPPLLRLLALACVIAALGLAIWKWLLPVITCRRDAYAIALRVESKVSHFNGRLVSRVQFRQLNGDAVRTGASAELIEAACQRIDARAADLQPEQIVDLRPTRVPAIAAGLVLLITAATVLTTPAMAGIWLRRTFSPFSSAAWPRRTHIEGVDNAYRVRRGDTLDITGRLSGSIPRSVELSWYVADPADSTAPTGLANWSGLFASSQRFDVSETGEFTATLGPLLEPMRLSVRAGDARLEGITVDVIAPPELAGIEAVYHYPAYTARQPDRLQSGDVRALVGTRVELTLSTDRPVDRMELRFVGSDDRITATLDSATRGRASFFVRAPGRYQVHLFDRFGFSPDAPPEFVIDPIDDRLPQVTILRPGSQHAVTPASRVRLVFSGADDYGITAAAIQWGLRTADAEPGALPGREPIPVATTHPSFESTYHWDLAALPLPPGQELKPGDEIVYRLELRDAGEHLTEEKAALSAVHTLKVQDPESLRQSLETLLSQSFAELDRLEQEQSAVLDAVSTLAVSLPRGDDPLLAREVQRLQVERNRQVALQRRLERLSESLLRVGAQLEESFLAGPERIAHLRELATTLDTLSIEQMPEVIERLRVAHSVLEPLASPSGGRQ